jgi:hypothetical protein
VPGRSGPDELSAARQKHIKAQLAAADGTKGELWQACSALVAAALQTGTVRETTNELLAMAAEIRQACGPTAPPRRRQRKGAA